MAKLLLFIVALGAILLVAATTVAEARSEHRGTASPKNCSSASNCDSCAKLGSSGCLWCSKSKRCENSTAAALPRCSAGYCSGGACQCEESCTKGLFPCSASITGELLLMAMYGVLLAYGAKLISDGSEGLLEVIENPGVVGGLVLPVLGAVPDSAIVIFSGAAGRASAAQDQLSVGVGTLAGSTIMLLTLPWAVCLLLARCDLNRVKTDVGYGQAIDCKATTWHPLRAGVTVDRDTRNGAIIMLLTSITYFIVQGVAFRYVHEPGSAAAHHIEKWFALAGFVVASLLLVAYCVYQVVNPKLAEKQLAEAKRRYTMHIVSRQFVRRLAERQAASVAAGGAAPSESSPLLAWPDASAPAPDVLAYGLKWKRFAKKKGEAAGATTASAGGGEEGGAAVESSSAATSSSAVPASALVSVPPALDIQKAAAEAIEDSNEGGKGERRSPFGWVMWVLTHTLTQSLALLLIGTAAVAIFSDPMVDVIGAFGKTAGIPTFYVSFLLTPFCSNASEVISSLIFAAKKRVSNSSLTYSQLYGAATMNNTMVLGIFFALVAFRDLAWEFTSETVAILLVTWAVGIIGAFNTTYRLFWFPIVLSFYPLSLVFVYVLDEYAHLK